MEVVVTCDVGRHFGPHRHGSDIVDPPANLLPDPRRSWVWDQQYKVDKKRLTMPTAQLVTAVTCLGHLLDNLCKLSRTAGCLCR